MYQGSTKKEGSPHCLCYLLTTFGLSLSGDGKGGGVIPEDAFYSIVPAEESKYLIDQEAFALISGKFAMRPITSILLSGLQTPYV